MGIQDREYYRDEQSGFRFGGSRMMVTNLLVVTVAIFLLDAFTPKARVMDLGREEVLPTHLLAYTLSLKANLLDAPWNFWQLVTHGFAHSSIDAPRGGIWHIAMNMFMLWMFGYDVERRYGRLEFLRFYLTAIVVAGIAWLVGNRIAGGSDGAYALGASGAISAMMLLYVFTWPKRTLFLMGIVPIPAWLVGVLWVASDLAGQVTGRDLAGRDNVAFMAHLGGAAFGSLYYLLHWNLGRVVPDRWFNLEWMFRRRPPLKVHDPERYYQDRDAEADRVLEKLHTQGEASLTAKERQILEDYSRRMRQKHR